MENLISLSKYKFQFGVIFLLCGEFPPLFFVFSETVLYFPFLFMFTVYFLKLYLLTYLSQLFQISHLVVRTCGAYIESVLLITFLFHVDFK